MHVVRTGTDGVHHGILTSNDLRPRGNAGGRSTTEQGDEGVHNTAASVRPTLSVCKVWPFAAPSITFCTNSANRSCGSAAKQHSRGGHWIGTTSYTRAWLGARTPVAPRLRLLSARLPPQYIVGTLREPDELVTLETLFAFSIDRRTASSGPRAARLSGTADLRFSLALQCGAICWERNLVVGVSLGCGTV